MNTPNQSIETLYAVGHWLLGQERFADASTVFRTMTAAAPSDERGWLALGACHEGIGQFQIATRLYETAEVVAAPAIRCTIARGRALRTLGIDDIALDAFEAARELALANDEDELAKLALAEKGAT